MEIQKDFFLFVPVFNLTGVGIANIIKTNLQSAGLDLKNIRGQGQDGASTMRGQFRGVQAIIHNEFPNALYTHCSSYCLNLCINDASKVLPIQNVFSTMAEVCNFFRSSARRSHILKERLKASSCTNTLMKYCETRCVERHDAVAVFTSSLTEVVESLEELIEAGKDDCGKVSSLHMNICSFQFVVSIFVSEKMLGITHHLSEYMQNVHVDLNAAMEHVTLTSGKLTLLRQHSDEEFHCIYQKCVHLAQLFGITLSLPRHAGTQRYRENHEANTPEEYFRRSVFVPYLDDLMSSLREQFSTHKNVLGSLQNIIPTNCV